MNLSKIIIHTAEDADRYVREATQLSEHRCIECKIRISNYEKEEKHGLCLDCYANLFQ